MEEGLLPNENFKALCKDVVVALVRKSSGEREGLVKEFTIPYGNSHLIVLDAKGETLASVMGDSCGGPCSDEGAKKFPDALVAKTKEFLKRPKSYEQLESEALKNINDEAAFRAFAGALTESGRSARLLPILDEILTNKELKDERRPGLRLDRLRAMQNAGYAIERMFDPEWKARLVQEAESLLVEQCEANGAEIKGILTGSLFSGTFDVKSKAEASFARIRKAAEEAPQAKKKVLLDLVAQMTKDLETNLEGLKQGLKRCQEADAKANIGFYAALLGDAELAVKHLKGDKLRKPMYDEAKKRLEEKQEK